MSTTTCALRVFVLPPCFSTLHFLKRGSTGKHRGWILHAYLVGRRSPAAPKPGETPIPWRCRVRHCGVIIHYECFYTFHEANCLPGWPWGGKRPRSPGNNLRAFWPKRGFYSFLIFLFTYSCKVLSLAASLTKASAIYHPQWHARNPVR